VKCPTCGGELIQQNRLMLIAFGICTLFAAAVTIRQGGFVDIVIALALMPIGGYLIFWAVLAKGLWCRTCKKFPLYGK